MTANVFCRALTELFEASEKAGRNTVVVRSDDLHQLVGGCRGAHHRLQVCCDVIYAEMIEGVDEIHTKPPIGRAGRW